MIFLIWLRSTRHIHCSAPLQQVHSREHIIPVARLREKHKTGPRRSHCPAVSTCEQGAVSHQDSARGHRGDVCDLTTTNTPGSHVQAARATETARRQRW